MPSFHLHPDVVAVVAGIIAAYLLAWRARARQVPRVEDSDRRRKTTLFMIGAAVVFAGSVWPVHDLSEQALYSVHMLQHMLYTLVAAPLMLAGTPDWMARALLRPGGFRAVWRFLTKPLVALLVFNGVLLASHWPEIVNATVQSEPLHLLAHVVIFGSAILMWWPVLSPLSDMPPISLPGQMVYLFLMSLAPTVPAAFLIFGESPLYAIYETFPRLFGISAIDDQRVAGLLMKLGGGFILWGFIAAIFFKWFHREQETGWDALAHPDLEREIRAGREVSP